MQEEWSSLIIAVDEAHASTTVPLFPCSFICVPCIALFTMCYCTSRRHEKLVHVVETENARMMPQGLEWVLTPNRHRSMDMAMALRWTPDRPDFEAGNPHRRPVSREPPIELVSPELRALRPWPTWRRRLS